MNLVIDCSFIMSSIVPDEKQEEIDKVFKGIFNGEYKVVVPAVFYMQCNNVLISSLKKLRINLNVYKDYLQILSDFPFHAGKFCTKVETLQIIGTLVIKYNLTSYDAAYLELSKRLEAKMATLDQHLSRRCKEVVIETII